MNILLKSTPIIFISFILGGCPLEGDDGAAGVISTADISATIATLPDLHCWDLNSNGIQDPETEDRNRDGEVNVKDCHMDPDIIKQTTGATYDHEESCKAFHALGLDAAAIAALGCHSQPTSDRLGTVQRMTGSILIVNDFIIKDLSDGSAGDIILFNTEDKGSTYINLNAYIAKERSFDFLATGGYDQCATACDADNECIAAVAELVGTNIASESSSFDCHIFHQSDSLDSWRDWCGFGLHDLLDTAPVPLTCDDTVSGQYHLWIRSRTTY